MLTVLFLDDFRDPTDVFPRDFCRENHFTICRTAQEIWDAVRKGQRYDLWSLDHDMLPIMQKEGEDHLYPPSGYDFLRQVQRFPSLVYWPIGKVYVHSANPWGTARMRELITLLDQTFLCEV